MNAEALEKPFVAIPKSALVVSIVFHLTAFFILLTGTFIEKLPWAHPKPIDTQALYQDFIQVDVVDMPEQLRNKKIDASQPLSKTPGVVPETAEKKSEESSLVIPKEVTPEIKKDAKKELKKEVENTDQKAERDKALKKLTEDARREAAIKNLSRKKKVGTGRAKLAGNRLSKGSSVSGVIGAASDQYIALLTKVIKEHFNVYSWQQKRNLVAIVSLELYTNGRIKDRRLITRSADPLYNSDVLHAIDAAEPLPVPEDLSLLGQPFRLEFRSRE